MVAKTVTQVARIYNTPRTTMAYVLARTHPKRSREPRKVRRA